MLERTAVLENIRSALKRSPAVALLGPRQCGKTTLARLLLAASAPGYFDLEDPVALARLDEPMTSLGPLKGLVVIDEVQRRPELFPVLRVLADRRPRPARFLILGSASPPLLRQSSESLAGRLALISLSGFTLDEVGPARMQRHWLRGGFPPSFLARSEADSVAWRRDFVRTFLERDVPQLGAAIPAAALHRFWMMLAHVHAGIWNAADPARSLGLSEPTVRRYLDLLSDVFMVRQLSPWFENISKRQVKSPKVFIRDSGLLHQLLGIGNKAQLWAHPRRGASWEGYVVEQVIHAVAPQQAFFWATHTGAELDLLLFKDGRRLGVEIKLADAPALTPSMRIAMADLGLEQLVVIHPGRQEYALAEAIRAVPFDAVADGVKALFPPRRIRAQRRLRK